MESKHHTIKGWPGVQCTQVPTKGSGKDKCTESCPNKGRGCLNLWPGSQESNLTTAPSISLSNLNRYNSVYLIHFHQNSWGYGKIQDYMDEASQIWTLQWHNYLYKKHRYSKMLLSTLFWHKITSTGMKHNFRTLDVWVCAC